MRKELQECIGDLMLLNLFIKMLVFFTAVALLLFGLTPDATFSYLARLLAVSLGSTIIIAIIYPHARGIKKGDQLLVMEEFPTIFFGATNATALNNGRAGEIIKIEFIDKSTGMGEIVSYEGFFSAPKVKLLERTVPIEIRK